jgi:tRNA-specific 2-thiouridylase
VLDIDGAEVGTHRGTPAYSVGQRQGLGVALGAPRYVSRIDPISNTIQLGRREDLETRRFTVERTTFVTGTPPAQAHDGAFRAAVRIRHRTTPIPATVRPADDHSRDHGRWSVETDTPVWAAAPGQAAVLYDGEFVVGGGRIAAA